MEEIIEPYLNGVALGLLFSILIGGVYLVIYIHDIPYEIAKKRNHPQQDAFHAAGWVSLFLMHAIWPLLWIWAFWYKDDAPQKISIESSGSQKQIADLETEVGDLKEKLKNALEKGNNATEINQKEN